MTPVGRLYYLASMINDDLHAGLTLTKSRSGAGAQAGEARLREVVTQGGLTQFRRATETPFNIVLEARL